MESLKVLITTGKLNVGETIGSDLVIVKHGEWSSSFKRFWYGESRETTISLIEKAISDLNVDNISLDQATKYIDILEKSLLGIQNLIGTYSEDKDIQERLNACHLKIRNYITRLYHFLSKNADEDKETEFNVDTKKEEEQVDVKSKEDVASTKDLTSSPVENEVSVNEIKEDLTSGSVDKVEEKHPFRDTTSEHTLECGNVKGCSIHKKKSKEEKKDTKHKENDFKFLEKENSFPEAKTFDRFFKKRKRVGGRNLFIQSERDNGGSHHRLPDVHVVTMGDVLSDFENMSSTLSNSYSSSSKSEIPKYWYTEKIIKA